MKSFIINFFIVLLSLIVIDLCSGFVFDKVFYDLPSKQSETSQVYCSLFPTRDVGVLVLGSSTANHHYNTRILSDRLGEEVFNAGLDGHDIIYSDLVFNSFLTRGSLHYVILDINTPSIDGYWKNRLGVIKPYYGRNQYVTNYFKTETDWNQRIKLKSNIYRYNGTLHSILSMALLNRAEDTLNGYRPLVGSHTFVYKTVRDFHPDSDLLKHLDGIVQQCKENDINLVIVLSPSCIDNPYFNGWLESYGRDNNVTIIMENKESLWKNHPEYFYDGNHLNSKGADVLTERICKVLNSKQ